MLNRSRPEFDEFRGYGWHSRSATAEHKVGLLATLGVVGMGLVGALAGRRYLAEGLGWALKRANRWGGQVLERAMQRSGLMEARDLAMASGARLTGQILGLTRPTEGGSISPVMHELYASAMLPHLESALRSLPHVGELMFQRGYARSSLRDLLSIQSRLARVAQNEALSAAEIQAQQQQLLRTALREIPAFRELDILLEQRVPQGQFETVLIDLNRALSSIPTAGEYWSRVAASGPRDVTAIADEIRHKAFQAAAQHWGETAGARGGLLGRLLGRAGWRPATVGDIGQVSGLRLSSHEQSLFQILRRELGEAADELELGRGLFVRQLGEGRSEALDIRNLLALGQVARSWADMHLRVPVIPYLFQFTPTRFLPWVARSEPEMAALIRAGEYQPFLGGVAGELTRQPQLVLGQSRARLFTVRLAQGAPEEAGAVSQSIELEQVSREFERANERAGFWQSISRTFLRDPAEAAVGQVIERLGRPEDTLPFWEQAQQSIPVLGWLMRRLDLGRQTTPSFLARVQATLSKWTNPEYGPRAWQELLDPGMELSEVEISRRMATAARYLGSRARVGQGLETWLGIDPNDRLAFIRRVGQEMEARAQQAASAAASPESLEPVARNPAFRRLWYEYQRNPEAFLTGFWRQSTEPLFEIPFLGSEQLESGLEPLYRQAVREAAMQRLNLGTGGPIDLNELQAALANVSGQPEEAAFLGHLVLREALGRTPYRQGEQLLRATLLGELATPTDEAIAQGLPALEAAAPTITRTMGRLSSRLELGPVEDELEVLGRRYLLVPRGVSVGDMLRQMNAAARTESDSIIAPVQRWIGQYSPFLGREDILTENFTATTFVPYYLAFRLNRMLEPYGLALGSESLGSAAGILWGLVGKRALPIMLAGYYGGYVGWELENFTGIDPGDVYAEARKQVSLGLAEIRDLTGLTSALKRAWELMPGLENYWQPRSAEELEDYYERGYDPVRQGRWWLIGRTPWYGGRIRAWAPNWYRLKKADLEYVRMGGAANLYRHSWLPTPRYPYSPLLALLDPYWKEKALAEQGQLFPVSGPLFDESFPGAELLNLTIGRLIKPERPIGHFGPRRPGGSRILAPLAYRMNEIARTEGLLAAMAEPNPVEERAQELASQLDFDGADLGGLARYRGLLSAMGPVVAPVSGSEPLIFGLGLGSGAISLQPGGLGLFGTRLQTVGGLEIGATGLVGPADSGPPMAGPALPGTGTRASTDYRPGPSAGPGLAGPGGLLYSTPTGRLQTGILAPRLQNAGLQQQEIVLLNEAARSESPLYRSLVPARMVWSEFGQPFSQPVPPPNVWSNQDPRLQLARTLYSVQEMAGLYGWLSSLITGEPFVRQPILQPASRGYDIESRFWGREMGGSFTGSLLLSPIEEALSELVRRFIPHRRRSQPEWNEVPNPYMPGWLPSFESGYFVNLQTGAPAVKVGPFGLGRVPGPGYEAVWGPVEPYYRNITPSSLGLPLEEQVQIVLGLTAPIEEDFSERVLQRGEELHELIAKQYKRMGLAVSSEVPILVPGLMEPEDKPARIDVLLMLNDQLVPLELKTTSLEALAGLDQPRPEHVSQLNAYLAAIQAPYGYLEYVARSDLSQRKRFRIEFDPELFERDIQQANRAKEIAQHLVETGQVNRWDVISDMDKVRILSNIAPWSQEYRYYLRQVSSNENLTEEEREELAEIRERVKLQKQSEQIYPYRFLRGRLDWETVHVSRILSPSAIQVEEYEQPIRLAGLRVSEADENRGAILSFYEEVGIRPGAAIRIAREPEESDDIYGSYRAAIRAGGENVGLRLLEMGLATPSGRADTAVEVYNRYSWLERAYGSLWERIFHSNIPLISTKLLPLRSGLEQYKRAHLYGTVISDWSSPWSGYLRPALRTWAASDPIRAALGAAFLFGAFTPRSTLQLVRDLGRAQLAIPELALGRRLDAAWQVLRTAPWHGAKIGLVVGATLSLGRMAVGFITGRPYIPGQRRREFELLEYWDILNYLKWRGIYHELVRRAEEEEGRHVRELVGGYHGLGRQTQKRIRQLLEEKQRLLRSEDPESAEQRIAEINQELRELHGFRHLSWIGPWTMLAIEARSRMERTLYGVPRDNYQAMIAALPKHLRPSIEATIQYGTRSEQAEMFRLLPPFIKRAVAPWLHQKWSDRRPNLVNYFHSHFLPPAHWPGWRPEIDLEDVKVQSLALEGIELREVGYWENQLIEAEAKQVGRAPQFDVATRGPVKALVRQVMEGHGLRHVQLQVGHGLSQWGSLELDMDLDEDWTQGRLASQMTNQVADLPLVR